MIYHKMLLAAVLSLGSEVLIAFQWMYLMANVTYTNPNPNKVHDLIPNLKPSWINNNYYYCDLLANSHTEQYYFANT